MRKRRKARLKLNTALSTAQLRRGTVIAMARSTEAVSASDWLAQQDERQEAAKAACAARRERRAARERGDA